MRPKPKMDGRYVKLYEDAMREWIADAMLEAAERMEKALGQLPRVAYDSLGHEYRLTSEGSPFATPEEDLS